MTKVIAPELDGPGSAPTDLAQADLVSSDRIRSEHVRSDRIRSDQGDTDGEGVEAGAVFLARSRHQRRVWAVRDGRVHFFVRPPGGGTFWSPGHPPHLAPTVELFLAEVAGRLTPGAGRDRLGAAPTAPHAPGPDRPIPPHKNAYR